MNVPISKGERCIIVDAGSEEGFVKGARLIYDGKSTSGDYHGEMNSEKFIGWLRGQLIPNLPSKSVVVIRAGHSLYLPGGTLTSTWQAYICPYPPRARTHDPELDGRHSNHLAMDAVIDNASYHSVQEDKCPTQSSRKADISWVHMQNLHPGASLHPGCKFAPRVYFWPCERCFKNLHSGANLLLLLRWSKFICIRVQICSRVQFVHMNANCLSFIRLDRKF